jgi:hypothetical protein
MRCYGPYATATFPCFLMLVDSDTFSLFSSPNEYGQRRPLGNTLIKCPDILE